ncbi:MAG: hypothetical protein COB30_005660 [Ectothiorhodospiraceae bacterium]|nr:hypothetical protein [Ectothiorhodospiraceae bacterium]
MSKLCSKFLPLSGLMVVLNLVACGGQSVKPDNGDPEMMTESMSEPELSQKTATADAMMDAESKKPVETPEVEVSPRNKIENSQIDVEQIPAKADAAMMDHSGNAMPESMTETISDSVMSPAADKMKMGGTSTSGMSDDASSKMSATTSDMPAVAASSGPNNFVVTVAAKQPDHPAYGKGHPMGFLVNGVSGKELVVERGQSYRFDISTNPKHDVYLSKKAIGWGGAPYSTGVEGAYTYKGTMVFKPGKESPNKLYYACRNHPYMGAVIHVVNPGQKIKLTPRAAKTSDKSAKIIAPKVTVTESKVKQKLMFAEMMAGARGAKRVMASNNAEARKMVTTAKGLVSEARSKSLVGALPEALALANKALKMLSAATRLVPGDEELAQLAENYSTVLSEIKGYQKSYQDNVKALKKQGALGEDVTLDEKSFSGVLAKAEKLAAQKDYVRANKLLQQAQATITGALHKMLDSKTLVYDLNFETAADEYEYEVKRFVGYEELIPIAIEAKKPAAGAVKLMESFLNKARKRRDEAQSKADSGDYSTAISMMLQATKTVRRALRMVGVTQ